MNRPPYPSDLTDAEWRLLEPLLPPPQPGGRPVKYPRREIVNAILYILRTGAAWRLLPHDLPPYRIVFHYYTTALGVRRASGRKSTLPCVNSCGKAKAAIPNPAPPSSTANP